MKKTASFNTPDLPILSVFSEYFKEIISINMTMESLSDLEGNVTMDSSNLVNKGVGEWKILNTINYLVWTM